MIKKIKEKLNRTKISVREWSVKHAGGKGTKTWLALWAFTESIFFPVIVDIFLAAIIMSGQKRRWLFYSVFTGVFSAIGGVGGYLVGWFFFDTFGQSIISFFNLADQMANVSELFAQNAFWAVFVAGFTFIPYKIFTISAGFFGVNFLIFVIASVLSRLARCIVVGYLVKTFGSEITRLIFKYFGYFVVIIILIVILLLFLL